MRLRVVIYKKNNEDYRPRITQAEQHAICAEGYALELESRGYLAARPWVSDVVLDHPDVVHMLHEKIFFGDV